MKIPEAPAPPNVGAYYGNEENGQWQPNGVIIDSGVGGGVVGSGDAGVHRPPVYPVHIPRGHIPGYVMAGAYYPPAYPPAPPAPQDDFADYMWMENEEEFDKQVMQQLEEEALMEQCIEAMLEDEQRERRAPTANGHNNPTTSNGTSSLSLEETVSRSTLNPLAAEFVPTRRPPPSPTHTDKQDSPETTSAAESSSPSEDVQNVKEEAVTQSEVETKKEDSGTDVLETTPPPSDPPEVSAADVQPSIDKPLDKRPKERREVKPKVLDPKKTVKVDPKKVKPVPAKSETKVQTPVKKKEVKPVKSEAKVEKLDDVPVTVAVEETVAVTVVASVVEAVKQTSPPPEEVPSGPKPINYAAAAKANKPKKPSSPPIQEKPTPVKTEKPTPVKKERVKDKPMPRKNSTK
ncbi:uncharacterized protein [Epargyreus clarus]|uniref:uncharacterized protein isoform X2 n=1 Tax=Epargyreus clarus TaxID=520877 RepID=UPI003C305DFE